MVDEIIAEAEARLSPGAMLKVARESQQLSEREAADQLNWMPGYVAIIERDDYEALRRPSFARGYVKAFGRLVELEEKSLMTAFESIENRDGADLKQVKKPPPVPLDLQKTGRGVIVGLAALCVLIATLWWWQQGSVL